MKHKNKPRQTKDQTLNTNKDREKHQQLEKEDGVGGHVRSGHSTLPTLTPATTTMIIRQCQESTVTSAMHTLLPGLRRGLPHHAVVLFIDSLEPALEVKPLAASAGRLSGNGGKVSVDGAAKV